jgi:demethylsterigmatocystin 6-O-methyltransferase
VESLAPAIWALPSFLTENKYQDIVNPTITPLQKAWNIGDQNAFIWVQSKPENFFHFNRFMQTQHQGMRQWLDLYPIEEKTRDLKDEQVVFVDVAGGIGHQSVTLRKHLPSAIKNRVIVEDFEAVLKQAIQHQGVETLSYDFFDTQPIKGRHNISIF